jgi:putative chitinase
MYDRTKFFDAVRANPFPSALNQGQVDGMSAILDVWEDDYGREDPRWLAYALATTKWETSSEMQPIEEYGKGGDSSYAQVDPETGQAYYGRGYVQLTWRDNYARADKELGLTDARSCEWHAENALDLTIAADVMFRGMMEGWFRTADDGTKETLAKYFSDTRDDPYEAREIINGDKTKVPSWSGGISIGNYIAGDHRAFLDALQAAWSNGPIQEVFKFLLVAEAAKKAPAKKGKGRARKA